jgi:hypothetical protein
MVFNEVDMDAPFLRRGSMWLILPPIALCILDFGLTLYGQADAYWQGDYSVVNELSPSFARYLSIHPLAFVAAAVVWIGFFSLVILLLPEKPALILVVTIVIGHMAGAATWLAYRLNSYQSCNALFLLTAGLIVVCFKKGQAADGSAAFNWQRTGLPNWIRWVVIVALTILPIWWFIIPR